MPFIVYCVILTCPFSHIEWWNMISNNHSFKPAYLALFSLIGSFPVPCLWSVSKPLVAIRWHLSYTSSAFLSLSAVFELLTLWQLGGPSAKQIVPDVTFWLSEEDTWNLKWMGSEEGGFHLFFISCQRAVSHSTGRSICLISYCVSPFIRFPFEIDGGGRRGINAQQLFGSSLSAFACLHGTGHRGERFNDAIPEKCRISGSREGFGVENVEPWDKHGNYGSPWEKESGFDIRWVASVPCKSCPGMKFSHLWIVSFWKKAHLGFSCSAASWKESLSVPITSTGTT